MLQAKPGWTEIDAVRNGRVYLLTAMPTSIAPARAWRDSGEILAQMLHGEPELSNHATVACVGTSRRPWQGLADVLGLARPLP